MLIPVHFPQDTTTYFMQLDTGSPYTLFYNHFIEHNLCFTRNKDRVATHFYIGKMEISSQKFRIFQMKNSAVNSNIIGTLGTDLLENRKTRIHFQVQNIQLNCYDFPKNLWKNPFPMEFKKGKILLIGEILGKKRKFLYDSGTSGYHMLISKNT